MEETSEVGLKRELDGLLRYMNKVRSEVSAIGRPADEDHGFESMGEQLDAILGATADATNTIMGSMEKNDDITDKLREKLEDPELIALLDQLNQNSSDVFEACSFQDITGQRISKVVKSITYVEERVNSLMDYCEQDDADIIPVEAVKKTEDEALLNGPQLDGQGLSQDDIDALFD